MVENVETIEELVGEPRVALKIGAHRFQRVYLILLWKGCQFFGLVFSHS
jgi:hypothetical protein